MEPVVTPAEMAVIDADAPEPVAELIERAGWATAVAAKDLLGRSLYGKRILVLVGKGNNGADGRSAARYLDRQGARCTVVDVVDLLADEGLLQRFRKRFGRGRRSTDQNRSTEVPALRFDLVIDACFGTGLRRNFDGDDLPIPDDVPVLAVDIPSGVDGMTGAGRGGPIQATATVTFAAMKPGLLLEPGRSLAGRITVADIGLDCSRATIHHLDRTDITTHWPRRAVDHHKWRNAVLVVGGGPGMTGAPGLSARGALRAGAGYAQVAIPGTDSGTDSDAGAGADQIDGGSSGGGFVVEPVEAVGLATPIDWVPTALAAGRRCGAVVIGPGLPTPPGDLGAYIAEVDTPTVFDAGILDSVAELLAAARKPGTLAGPDGQVRHVLTPHDGEFRRLFGRSPSQDRIADVRAAAASAGAVVLLKGPTTVVAHPDGRVLLSTTGDQRLATAGSGDVLAGVIAAGLAGGLDPLLAAAVGAELHGTAGLSGYRVGMTAGDLPSLIAAVLSE
ncbi:MAG: NAD(P)H-hydrate epimerase [Actinomycetota bacterium]